MVYRGIGRAFIGPYWEYVNPQGVRFIGWTAGDVTILQLAARLRES